MTAPDLFGVLVRFTGFAIALYGFYTFFYGIAVAWWEIGQKDKNGGRDSTAGFLLCGAVIMVLGWVVMSTAGVIVSQCYPSQFVPPETSEGESSARIEASRPDGRA